MKNLVIFYDGYCGLCSWSVDFILKWDKKHKFKFSPLSGIYAGKTLPPQYVHDPSTIILFNPENSETLIKSDAALRIAKELSFPFFMFIIFIIIPKVLRDKIYEFISLNRYNIAKRRESCRLPTSEEREKFILE